MYPLDCVVITGAGQGIGRAVAVELGRHGTHILCLSKSNNCQKTAAGIEQAGGNAESLVVDIGDVEKTKCLVAAWAEGKKYEKIGLVLAASILGPRDYEDLTGWEQCYRVNVLGNLAVYQGILPRLLANKFGRIVSFAGGGAAYAFPLFPAYAASKAAMVRTVENMQEELNGKGDFVAVCLAPGANDTEMLKEIRAAGAQVKTTVAIHEPVDFVSEFLACKECGFKGAFVHVRDNWKEYLDSGRKTGQEKWKLRRIES